MANWILEDLNLKITKPSGLKLKVADQRCVKSLGMLSKVPRVVNGVTVKIDFHILGITES
jgi:hypothetical protein